MYFMEEFIDSLPNIHYINNKICITLNYNKFYSYYCYHWPQFDLYFLSKPEVNV